MADFVLYTAGSTKVLEAGVTGTVTFALSTRDCDTHKAADTLGGGVGEITGTGYARASQSAPSPSAGKVSFAEMEWKTEAATNWPASVKSVVAIEASTAICAWNLQAGGGARDLSGANTTEKFTPTLQLS